MAQEDGRSRSRESDAGLRNVYMQSPLGIELYDGEGVILAANPAGLELFGVGSVEDLVALRLCEVPNLSEDARARARGGESLKYRVELDFDGIRREGKVGTRRTGRRVFDRFLAPWAPDDAERAGYMVHTIDVTDWAEAERKLYESQEMLQLVLDTIPQRVFWKDRRFRYLGCNRPFARDAHLEDPAAIIGKEDFALSWKESAELYRADDRFVMESGVPKLNYEEPQAGPAGSMLWLRTSKVPLRDVEGNVFGILGTYEDVTEKKHAELERENLVVELQRALAKVNTLSGLLPMCASCRKIRDDSGYWTQVEEYFAEHTEVKFSHGICPECMKRLYPEYRKSK
jgi:PAS domain S-box-containing protein